MFTRGLFLNFSIFSLFKEQTPREYFLWMPVCLGLGAGMYFMLPHYPIYMTFAPLICVIIGIFYNKILLRSYFLYGLLYIILGYLLMILKVGMLETPLPQAPLNNISIQGTVQDILDREEGQQWILSDIKGPSIPLKKIKLTVKDALTKNLNDIHIGDRLHARISLFPFHAPIFPGGLDQRRKAYLEGISAQGNLNEVEEVIRYEPKGIAAKLMHLRRSMTSNMYAHIKGEEGAIAAALVTGERSKISFTTRQAFADSGIAHILAISGLHLSLIAGFVFFVIRGGLALSPYLAETYAIKKWAAGVAILFTFMYLLISGLGYPSIRAFIMTSIAMIAIMVDRRAISMRILAIAAFTIILIYPDCVISASFQLSFAAVTALIAFYDMGWRPLYLWAKDGGWLRQVTLYVVGVGLSTVVATLATTPFTMFLFNRLTVQALLGNLLAIPLTGVFVMPSAFLATMSMIFGGWQWCFDLFAFSIKCLCWIAFWVQSFPGAAVLVPTLPNAFIVLFTFGGLWVCLWQGRLKLLGIPLMVGAVVLMFTVKQPDILISQKGIGVFEGGRLSLSKNVGWFEKLMWQRHLGVREVTEWAEDTYELPGHTLLIADPRDRSKPWLKNKCEGGARLILTNGYLDRICKNTHPFDEGREGIKLLSRVDLKDGGVIAVWLNPLHVEYTSQVDKDKPWG